MCGDSDPLELVFLRLCPLVISGEVEIRGEMFNGLWLVNFVVECGWPV